MVKNISNTKYVKVELSKLTAVQLVQIYNAISDWSVKKFRDKVTAESRVQSALDSAGKVVREDVKTGSLFVTDAKSPRAKKSRAAAFADTDIIKCLVEENPKREGTRSHYRFARLLKKDTMTVAEYIGWCEQDVPVSELLHARERRHYVQREARKISRADLIWDTSKNFVKISKR